MSKWISTSDIESSMGHKVLIAGLQEAGKTAVKRIFFLKQQATQVDGLKATLDYERMAVRLNNIPITVVDLGGQRIFIRRFLNSFSPFIFNSVHVLIFVIDVSIKSTRNNAVQYFASAMEKLKEYSPDADVYVFLHKNDLVRKLPNYESVHSQLKEQFQLESEKKIHFFRTTIFDETSIINAFGRIFELSIPKASKSKFVDGRTIGKGEEFSDKFAMSGTKTEEEHSCPFCNIQLFQTADGFECNICGYKPRKQIVIEDGPVQKPKVSVDDLKAKLTTIIKSEKEELEEASSLPNENEIPVPETVLKSTQTSSEVLTNNIVTNYRKILNLSYDRLAFERSVTDDQKLFLNFCINFGISDDILIFIINEFIPKFSPTNIQPSNANLIQLVSFFKSGYVKSKDFFKYLYYNEYFDNLTVEDILWNNYPDPFDDKVKETSEINLSEQPLDPELTVLSDKDNIGVKIYEIERNAELVFYQGKEQLGSITIPLDITEKDLKFMLVFEIKFPVKSNLQGFVEQATIKLIPMIEKFKNRGLVSKEDDILETSSGDTDVKETGQLRLSEKSDIYYKIIVTKFNFEIRFTKIGKNFGKISGPNTISAPGLFQLIMRDTTISTFISEDDLMFISLQLYKKFNELLS